MASNSLSRVVWKVSLPIILVEATETFDHLIDTLFLARVGVTELGAIAVAKERKLATFDDRWQEQPGFCICKRASVWQQSRAHERR